MLPEDSFYVPHDNREAASSKLKYIAWNSRKGDRARWSLVRDSGSVFIRISAQPRISAHLEWAPILKAEKVNKRPASKKRPPPPPPRQTQIIAHPHPTHLSE